MALTAIMGLKIPLPFGATIPICDVGIWQRQNNENYAVVVTVWTNNSSFFPEIRTVDNIGIFVQILLEINWK